MQDINYEEVVQLVRNNIASVMEDPYYDGYDIEVTSEIQFLKKKEAYKNRIYIVIKFSPATIFFGQTVLSLTITALSEQNHLFVCQKLLSDYAHKFNLTFDGDNIQQIYETPTVLLNFNEVYDGFRSVLSMSGTLVITTTINRFDFYYHYKDDNGKDVAEKVDLISSFFNFDNSIDSQAFYGTHDFASSIAKIASLACGFNVYLFTNSRLINDCMKIVSLAGLNEEGEIDKTNNIDNAFELEIRFKAKEKYINEEDGKEHEKYILNPIQTKFKLISLRAESDLGELPILNLSFAK